MASPKSKWLLILLGLAFWCTGVFAQNDTSAPNQLAQWINARKQTYSFEKTELFSYVSEATKDPFVKGFVKEGVLLKLNTMSCKEILMSKKANISLVIPTSNRTNITLELSRASVVTSDFTVFDKQNAQEEEEYEEGLHYRGIIEGDEHSLAAISIFDNMVMGIASDKNGNYVLGSLRDENNNYSENYIFYNDVNLLVNMPFTCDADELKEELEKEKIAQENNALLDNCRPVRIYFECDYKMYTDHGSSVSNVVNYVTGMFNAVATLYQNEQIPIAISQISIWHKQDIYASYTTRLDILNAFKTNTQNDVGGDLAHLLSTRIIGGGIAWVDALCTQSYKYAVSGNLKNYANFPAYSWNIMVIAHEMGHNFGSKHTQWCGWPGGAIDNCAATEPYPAGNPACPQGPAPQNGGTIMSYCHLTANGINFNNGFGPLPGDRIRNRYLNASCFKNLSIQGPVLISTQPQPVFSGFKQDLFLYETQQTILSPSTSTFSILSGARVEYKAGTSITLKPGFVANEGSTFWAHIDACSGPNSTLKTVSENSSLAVEINENKNKSYLKCYPNPFTGTTVFEFTMDGENNPVILEISDLYGKKVVSLIDRENYEPGNYKIEFNAENLASGIYICNFRNGNFNQKVKLVLQK